MADTRNPVVTAGDLIRRRDYYAALWMRKYGTMRGFHERCVELLAPGLGQCPKLPKSIA